MAPGQSTKFYIAISNVDIFGEHLGFEIGNYLKLLVKLAEMVILK